jgi:beta-xylosidase
MDHMNLNTSDYQQVKTYVNLVLPGDHPDPTLLKVGDDFYIPLNKNW